MSLLTSLVFDHAAAKLCKVEFRVARTQGPLDFEACFFPFFLLSAPFSRPCMEVRSAFLPNYSSLQAFLDIFIYLKYRAPTSVSRVPTVMVTSSWICLSREAGYRARQPTA